MLVWEKARPDLTPDTALRVILYAAVMIQPHVLHWLRGWGRAGQCWRWATLETNPVVS
jgi:hypothetical protein